MTDYVAIENGIEYARDVVSMLMIAKNEYNRGDDYKKYIEEAYDFLKEVNGCFDSILKLDEGCRP